MDSENVKKMHDHKSIAEIDSLSRFYGWLWHDKQGYKRLQFRRWIFFALSHGKKKIKLSSLSISATEWHISNTKIDHPNMNLLSLYFCFKSRQISFLIAEICSTQNKIRTLFINHKTNLRRLKFRLFAYFTYLLFHFFWNCCCYRMFG